MACLEAGAQHRQPLLALATKLTRSAEEGMNLYQQTLLNCHDAIQRHGFAGDRYEFYLYTSLKRLHYKQAKQQAQTTELPEDFADTYTAGPEPDVAGRQLLGEQLQAEAAARFSFADRVALRLHIDGYSGREIAELLGASCRITIWRRIEKMKANLKATFQSAWQALNEPDY